jgi:hypothetical protein
MGFFIVPVACTVLIGNVRPGVRKSDHYTIDAAGMPAPWYLSATREQSTDLTSVADPDYFFRSSQSGSTISVFSACKDFGEFNASFSSLRDEIFAGLTPPAASGFDPPLEPEQKKIMLGQPANLDGLQTTREGLIGGKPHVISAVVLVQGRCIFDFVLITKDAFFKIDQKAFERVLQSFTLTRDPS